MAEVDDKKELLPLEIEQGSPVDREHKLIVCIVKKGYAYEVVKTATENGGKGAVIMDGRGVSKDNKKFFGVEISPEKELVLMVVEEQFAYPVIKAVYAIADFKSNAKGVVFALPITTLMD